MRERKSPFKERGFFLTLFSSCCNIYFSGRRRENIAENMTVFYSFIISTEFDAEKSFDSEDGYCLLSRYSFS